MYQKFLFKMLMMAFSAATPEIVEGIRKGIDGMVKKAKVTVNPYDDILMGLLQLIVGHPNEPVPTAEEVEE